MNKFFSFILRVILLPVIIIIGIFIVSYYWLTINWLGHKGLTMYFKFKLLGRL